MEHLHRFSTRQQLDAQNATSSLDYCELRALGLTEGPIPNRAPESMAIIWSLFGLSTVFLALRVYCKIWRSRGLWWDDHILVASWLCFLGDAIMSQRAFDYGFGHYPCDINPANFPKLLFEGSGLGASFGILAIVWSKTSFAFTILRISKDKLRYFVIALTVVMNIAMALQLLFVWIRCNPIEKSWKLSMIEGKCWDMRTTDIYGVFAGSLSGMKKKERVGVMVAMSMGVFVGVVSFVKSSMILTRSGKNFTYYGSALLSWAAIEIGLTIIACCIPVLRVLFRDLRNSSIKKSERGDSYGISGSSGISARGMKYNTTVVSWGAESRKAANGWDRVDDV
ncbi:hypothetical protein QBC42DRAFT_180934 [Cladorrhinum samala]|uniref:Rhodopsin domain-containing protein n=1 Tax=Cladorrhinum samala TaxID=585594 RepID=A0AAV9HIA7_9PEZI|nr:hypothetical protein QBC42DRAFT_180934 [Cladorrhinum samala]